MSTRFDFILNPLREAAPRPENRIVEETEFFAAVPSIGSLVPGWLLIVPKRPAVNLGSLNEHERHDLSNLTRKLTRRLAPFAGHVYAFEHGSSAFGSISGCGVDQAHLHLVPLNFDLIGSAKDQPSVHWNAADANRVGDYKGDTNAEYLAVYDGETSSALFGYPKAPTSQWFRKVIAAKLGRIDEWDYRLHYGQDCVSKTLEILAASI